MVHIENDGPCEESIKIAEQLKIEQDNKDKYMNALVKLYQSQVHIIQNSGQFVTAKQKNAIEAEMKTLEKLTNKGYRTGKFSNDTNIPDTLFTTLLDEIIENCPIITSVIESLLFFNKKERNVNKQLLIRCYMLAMPVIVSFSEHTKFKGHEWLCIFIWYVMHFVWCWEAIYQYVVSYWSYSTLGYTVSKHLTYQVAFFGTNLPT